MGNEGVTELIAEEKDYTVIGIVRYAGAFIAWMIGSGFASGQETLQFFSSYGLKSYWAILLNLIGTLFLGVVFVETGFQNREVETFNHFVYFCGEKVGKLYSNLIAVIVFLLMSVLISGAGATLQEYYGLNHFVGSLLIALMVLGAYLIGFEKLVSVISKVGPVVILFILTVGVITVINDMHAFPAVAEQEAQLYPLQTSLHWSISSVLYLSLNFLSGGAYFTQLGISAEREKDVKYGIIVGAIALMMSIATINTAFLLNAEGVAGRSIPILYLAKKISHRLGGAFSVVLLLGIFSSCSSMMWTVCSRIHFSRKRSERVAAALICAGALLIGMLPFGKLISVFFPMVGYIGIVLLARVIYKTWPQRAKK